MYSPKLIFDDMDINMIVVYRLCHNKLASSCEEWRDKGKKLPIPVKSENSSGNSYF